MIGKDITTHSGKFPNTLLVSLWCHINQTGPYHCNISLVFNLACHDYTSQSYPDKSGHQDRAISAFGSCISPFAY